MKKAMAGVLVVFGMLLTAGATLCAPKARAPIYEPHRVTWSKFREDLRRAGLSAGLFECPRRPS